jgi:EamA domain-containing membrane protein RarD
MSGSAFANSRLKYFVAGLSANIIWGFFAIPLRLIAAWPADTILYFRIFIYLCVDVSLSIQILSLERRLETHERDAGTRQKKDILPCFALFHPYNGELVYLHLCNK